MRTMRNLGVLAIVVGAFFAITDSALAAPATSAAKATGGWTRLGGDPVVPRGVNTRNDLVRLITSRKGSVAMTYAGLTVAERSATVRAARTGDFRSCSLRYGMNFQRMSFGINGTSVDRNVTFLDPRYRHKPAAAWCINVPLGKGGPVLHLLVPVKCGNVAIIKRTSVPKKPTPPVVIVPPVVSPVVPPVPTAVCVTMAGVPMYAPLPSGITIVNGVCTTVQVTVPTISCNGNQTPITNSAGVVINCINNTNTNTVTVPVSVVVVVSPPAPVVVVTPPPVVVTPPLPKSNVDLCTNIVGEQTAIPAGFRKDPPDPGVPGNCYYVGP